MQKLLLRNQRNNYEFLVYFKPNSYFDAPKIRYYLGHFYEKKVKYDYAYKLKCVELVLKQHFTDDMFQN